MMWKIAMQSHEVYRFAILEALTHLSQKMKARDLRILFEKIRSQPLGSLDKIQMNMLKAIAIHAVQVI